MAGPVTSGSAAAETAVTETAPATTCPPPPCAPVTSATPVASGSAAPAASSAAELPVPPPATKQGVISGTVTAPGGLSKFAVVYLEQHPGDTNSAHQTVTIDNRQMNFIPYVAVAAVGAKVVFANTDPFPHNVFSPDNEKFNLGNLPQNGARSRVFEHPGAYSLLCNLHPGMLGYLLIVPSTHFVRVDAKGHFSMRDVPVGTWQVSAWAPRLKPVTQSVTVTEGETTATFELPR